MRSESLARLDSVQPPKNYGNAEAHREVDRQVAEFLAGGGVVQQIPTGVSGQNLKMRQGKKTGQYVYADGSGRKRSAAATAGLAK